MTRFEQTIMLQRSIDLTGLVLKRIYSVRHFQPLTIPNAYTAGHTVLIRALLTMI